MEVTELWLGHRLSKVKTRVYKEFEQDSGSCVECMEMVCVDQSILGT